MDPDSFNYNQPYRSGSLPTPHGTLNRYDLSLLAGEQGGTLPGLGLGAFPTHSGLSSAAARSFGPLPGYGHPLHNMMPQLQDTVSPLPTQAQYRSMSVGPTSFPFDTSVRPASADPYSLSRLTTQPSSHSKPLFTQEALSVKETTFSTSLSQQTLTLDTSPKGWGLSNFVPSSSNQFGSGSQPTDLSSSDMSLTSPTAGSPAVQAPPPAHSSKRSSTIQRNPFLGNEFFPANSRSMKSPTSQASMYNYGHVLDARSSSLSDTNTLTSPVYTNTALSQPSSIFPLSEPLSTVKTEAPTYSVADMNYDPVSPATPLSDAGQQNDTYAFQDLTSIASTRDKLLEPGDAMGLQKVLQGPGMVNVGGPLPSIQDLHEQQIQAMKAKTNLALQELYSQQKIMSSPGTPNGQLHQIKQSPTQQSPISVGGSPQSQLPLGSPQTSLITTTAVPNMIPLPVPVQAQADSTTKPKRRRKKKEPAVLELKKESEMPPVYGDGSGQMYSPHMLSQQMSVTEQAFSNSPDLKRQLSSGSVGSHGSVVEDVRGMQRSGAGMNSESYMGSPPGFLVNSGRGQPVSYNESVIRPSVNSSIAASPSSLMSPQHPQLMGANPIMGQKSAHMVSHSQHSQPSPYMKDEPSPGMGPPPPSPVPRQSPSMVPQQSPVTAGYQPSPPMSSHSVHYSVSDALEMSQAGIVGNRGDVFETSPLNHQQAVMDYGAGSATEMANAFGIHEGEDPNFSSPMGMARQMEMTDNMSVRHDQYPGSQDQSVFATNAYGGAFVNPNIMMNMEAAMEESPSHGGRTSTIDEAAFSSLMDESVSREPSPEKVVRYKTKAEQKEMYMPLTVKLEAEYDDDFQHLSKAPAARAQESNSHLNKHKSFSKPRENNHQSVLESPKSNPPPKVEIKSKGPSFMDSYLNFLQGKKPETLSSMSSAVIHNKPQLPKYIPEPPRPRRSTETVKSDDSASNTPKPETDSKSESGSLFSHTSPCHSQNSSVVTFSDDEEDNSVGSKIDSAVNSALSNLSDTNDKVKISTNKSGGLTMKINLAKVKASEEASARKAAKAKSKKSSVGKSKKSRSKSKHKDVIEAYEKSYSSGEEAGSKTPPPVETPARPMSARKAKDNKKKYNYTESDSDSDLIHEIRKPGENSDDERDYDSDKDPAWTPFSLEKKAPAYDMVDFDFGDRLKKPRPKSKGKSKPRNRKSSGGRKSSGVSDGDIDAPAPAKLVKLTTDPIPPPIESSESGEEEAGKVVDDQKPLQVGDFVLETKDLKNYENYPVWKIESGRMLHKYELFIEGTNILHRAVPTFSSWLPSMRSSFVHIRVNQVSKLKDKDIVEVLEKYRPKPAIDSKLEDEYEEHPLIEVFNVYLQIFLSQALEPGFLSAIRESKDTFYLDPLAKIDVYIDRRLEEIDSKVRWRTKFKECLKTRPHIRELDRPNLKQSCQSEEDTSCPVTSLPSHIDTEAKKRNVTSPSSQIQHSPVKKMKLEGSKMACEFASQPAIKSIHLFGNPYNRFSLEELTPEGGQSSQEFMIGKTATRYVKPYHNLFHFKYNLYKRCQAKINLIQDSGRVDNATILDQCLQNRAWVLQIFEDLKKMLEKG